MNVNANREVLKHMKEAGDIEPIAPEFIKQLESTKDRERSYFDDVLKSVGDISRHIGTYLDQKGPDNWKIYKDKIERALSYVVNLEWRLGETELSEIDNFVWDSRLKVGNVLLSQAWGPRAVPENALQKSLLMIEDYIRQNPDRFPNLHKIEFVKEKGVFAYAMDKYGKHHKNMYPDK